MKLSKYALQDYVICPKRFKAIHIDKIAQETIPEATLGTKFHEFAKDFFWKVPVKEAVKLKRLDDIKVLFASVVDQNASDELKIFEMNFAKFEAEHFWKLKELLPRDWKKYFYPMDLELEIETETMHIIVDRIDLLTTGESCVFEYKTGSYWNLTSLRRELAFYAVGLKSVRKYRDYHPVTHIACYNPRLDRFLFEKLGKRTIVSMLNWVQRMAEAIKKGKFEKKMSSFCRHCPLRRECFEDLPEWR